MTDQVFFITGASRGFGALIVDQALTQGHKVVATARNPDALTTRYAGNPNVLVLPLDVTNNAQAKDAAASAIRHFGHIDVLVNNAGYGLLGAVEESTPEEVEALYRTNVFGLLNVTRAVLPSMRARRQGRILNLSSIGGYVAHTGWGVYGSTKFAVEGLSEALALELKPLGIHVTAVEPGFFRTDFLDEKSLAVSPNQIDDYNATSGEMRQFAVQVNHAQPGNPEKLAEVLIDFVNTPNPPVRLPLGSDTVAAIERKNHETTAIVNAWRKVSVSTDFVQ